MAIAIVAVILDLVIWLNDGVFGLTSQGEKITFMLWTVLAVFVLSFVYVIVVFLGGHKAIRRSFSRVTGEVSAEQKTSARGCDARIGELRMELRRQSGWRWRYRAPWLMICGDDSTIEQVAPGLKQAGVRCTDEVVLVHAAPQGIDASLWQQQIRSLRRRRPTDAVVQVVGSDSAVASDVESLRLLSDCQRVLGWAAPIMFLYPVPVRGSQPDHDQPVGVFVNACRRLPDQIPLHDQLAELETRTANAILFGIKNEKPPFIAVISAYIGDQRASIASRWAAWQASVWRQAPLAGVMFVPEVAAPVMVGRVPVADASGDVARIAAEGIRSLPVRIDLSALRLTWREIARQALHHRGRRIGFYPWTAVAGGALACTILWTAGMAVSGLRNLQDIGIARDAMQGVRTTTDPAKRLHALLALQQQIDHYEYRTQHHAPWLTRFGLNRDPEVLAALWKPYTQAARQFLITPAQQNLEASLVDLGQLQTTSLTDQTSKWAMGGRDGLKAYLMLAHPERTEPAFLASQLAKAWTTEARITPGEKQDLAERLSQFYGQHLKSNPDRKIDARPELVAGARQTLLAVIGARNAQDTVYQQILDGAGSKYPDQTLASLTVGTDTRGLLHASAVVPGVFTRQAYEGYIADAIEEAVKRRDVSTDWVLAGDQARDNAPSLSAYELRKALTLQYFADYAEHWQGFMNALQWEPSPTLPAAIGQLKLLADARQSPVIALMKSLEYQGGAGVQKASLSDALVNKAKDMFTSKGDAPQTARSEPAGPLDAAFGPVLRLVGQSRQGIANSDLSLQRFLDRATALRLRLQQVNGSPDADEQARQMAQTLFQGKGSELADTQAYAQLMAASVGTEWAGMGEALFVRPIAQATQTIVLPAQASLNDLWYRAVVSDWNHAFAGRYPFADTGNDASLPEFAQFVRPQGGRIQTFLATQLAGVLELQGNQWVPATGARGITFDPEFLKFINLLQRIGAHLLVQGEPQYRFELKPVPTPGLTDTVLTIDGQKLHYYNQRETWQRMAWPSNSLADLGTRLQWQTETAGTNKRYEFGGRFGLLRMLARGHIQQIDGATYQIGWPAEPDTGVATAGGSDTAKVPEIQFQMRSESGAGVLDLLSLLGLKISPRVFLIPRAGTVADAGASPAERVPGTQ
ncbi:hypothetical protein LMG23992_02482 [Cupriavidus laharis]|uniref:Type VI secretion protein VasK n=1 Tax=Cupriavidus laharis TaxID=151654 RepID=A0ABN7YPR2_9BURK|nr:ImcF-related family protein [Cupriavidus laharis]CAG9173547.1 hypothetical protein LMG23992_02482 [Cupriavidus laharis]